jgi:hypothetical protein
VAIGVSNCLRSLVYSAVSPSHRFAADGEHLGLDPLKVDFRVGRRRTGDHRGDDHTGRGRVDEEDGGLAV